MKPVVLVQQSWMQLNVSNMDIFPQRMDALEDKVMTFSEDTDLDLRADLKILCYTLQNCTKENFTKVKAP